MMERDTEFNNLLQECSIEEDRVRAGPLILVIFGGTGDLVRRKLVPTLFGLFQQGRFEKNFFIIGHGHKSRSLDEYREFCRRNVIEHGQDSFDGDQWDRFQSCLRYSWGDSAESDGYERLEREIRKCTDEGGGTLKDLLLYFAVAPHVLPDILAHLSYRKSLLSDYSIKAVLEKPFGHDRQSAKDLDRHIMQVFSKDQVYRIDHYLGKETVQNILFLRFGNTVFEPLWNRKFIDHVQITVLEKEGVGQRAGYFDRTGIIRDMVQSHILQLMGLIILEPSGRFSAASMVKAKLRAYRSIRVMSSKEAVRNIRLGQYESSEKLAGYRDEPGVASGSLTPTFFAGRFFINNRKWKDVPFYVRTGKRATVSRTRISIHFHRTAHKLFQSECLRKKPNVLFIDINPAQSVCVRISVKYPGSGNQIFPVDLAFNFSDTFHQPSLPAYGRLLLDCIRGDRTYFEEQKGIEAMWNIVDPIIKAQEQEGLLKICPYAAGSWGPVEADNLIRNDEREWLTSANMEPKQ